MSKTGIAAIPSEAGSGSTLPSTSSGLRVAYLMSRFPKITETFVLREMIELEKLGYDVEVFPLRREKTKLIQPDAKAYVERAHFTSFISGPILWANLLVFFRQPLRYLATLYRLVRANLGCPRYLVGAVLFFPKAVYFSERMRHLSVGHIHAHFASHPAAVAFTIGRLAGIPYSFVAHGSDLHRDQHMLFEKTRDATFVVAISEYNREMILDVVGRRFANKIHVLHCGIDPTRFTPRTSPTPFARGEGPFRIVCIGTLHEVKGQSYLIEACRLLTERRLDLTCHLLGGGDDEEKLRQQIERSQLRSQVFLHGSCTSDEVIDHLKLADVLVAPSVPTRDGRREGIPVVLIEAMACSVPCVASRLSGIPELVEDESTGILTPPGDSIAIADALERLSQDPSLRAKFAANAVEKVKREFSLPVCVGELAQVIDSESQKHGTKS